MNPIDLLWILPGFFLQTLAHESAHAVVARIHGARIENFKPWPHRADGRFYFGRVTWTGHPPGWRLASTLLAPYALALINGLLLLAIWRETGSGPYLVLGCCVLWDFSRGMLQPLWREERGDLNQAIKALRRKQ